MLSYLAYRRDGGQSKAKIYARAAQAIAQGKTTELEQELDKFLGADASPRAKALIPKLQAILRGDHSPALAADPNLDYDDAVELQLLLESLGTE